MEHLIGYFHHVLSWNQFEEAADRVHELHLGQVATVRNTNVFVKKQPEEVVSEIKTNKFLCTFEEYKKCFE